MVLMLMTMLCTGWIGVQDARAPEATSLLGKPVHHAALSCGRRAALEKVLAAAVEQAGVHPST